MEAPAVVAEVELVVVEVQVEAEHSWVVEVEEDFGPQGWLATFGVLVAWVVRTSAEASLVRLRDSSDQASYLAHSSGLAIVETGL